MENTAYDTSFADTENSGALHFLSSYFLDDVIAVENNHVQGQISAYLAESEEDNGGMTLESLRKMAKFSGVKAAENISHKIEMIRAIQVATLHQPCFGSEQRASCKKEDCNWRYECKKS